MFIANTDIINTLEQIFLRYKLILNTLLLSPNPQLGCDSPPFGKKSIWPIGFLNPFLAVLVCMTSTK